MGIRDLTASILWLTSFLLAFTPLTHQVQQRGASGQDGLSFAMGAFGVVTELPDALQAYPLTNSWGKPTIIRVVQGGVNIDSDYDDEIITYKVKATAPEAGVKVANVKH